MSLYLMVILALLPVQAWSFDWQGHRGARGLYPENTIGSMEEALKYPVTTLELDIVLSKKLEIIVSHEPWMNEEICLDPEGKRFKGKVHNIYKMSYEEIAKFDCGSLPYPHFSGQKKISTGKPTLERLLEITEDTLKKLNRTKLGYNIEIKSSPVNEKNGFQPEVKIFSDTVIKFLMEKLPTSRFTVQSFDWRVLSYIHKTYPDVRLVALTDKKVQPEKDIKNLGFKPYAFSPYFKEVNKESVQYFKDNGIKVIPWTVNDVSDMEALIALGVDGIITDYPDRIPQVGQRKCKGNENLFEGKCVPLPKHALPSEANPGWVCKPGYIQIRSHCTKIDIPDHAYLLPDGKTWECEKGYIRYRTKCKKK